MKRKYSISVAMATYNGEKYIKEQLESIIKQLNTDDEIIISDDGSTDKTLEIIKMFNDKRIKIILGPKNGTKQNFANAIKHCSGKYIFLSDQDDIWMEGKVASVLNTFKNEDCQCVVHDCVVFDSTSNQNMMDSFYEYRKSGKGILKNIIKNSYLGCCMAFDSTVVQYILPIPNNIDMHDQWIGLLCEKYGKSIFIKEKLLKYRRHDKNVSKMTHYSISKMIKNRVNFIKEFRRR